MQIELGRRRKRGRPTSQQPMSPAERMRLHRMRRKRAALVRNSSVSCAIDRRTIEVRTLALHCLAARKINDNPLLLDKVKRTLDYRVRNSGNHIPRALKRWS